MISLLYATARPNLIWNRINYWIIRSSGFLPIEVIVCTDSDIYDGNSAVHFITNYGNKDCVTAYNRAAQMANGDIFVQIADDLFPCVNWDKLISESLDITRPQVLLISDDHLGRETTRHAICTRSYYAKLGYLLHPSYASMYSDDDFNEMARRHGEIVDRRGTIYFTHYHLGPERDDVSRRHESSARYLEGFRNFKKRELKGFPI